MELRLRLRARATKDVDIIVIPDRDADILDVLQDALNEPYLDFAFRLTDSRPIEHTPAQRMSVKMTYRGKSWATLALEASGPEAGSDEAEQISAFSLYTTRPRRTRRGCLPVAALSDRHQAARRDRALRRSRERPLPRPHRSASPARPRTGAHAAGRGMPRRLCLARQTTLAAAPDG